MVDDYFNINMNREVLFFGFRFTVLNFLLLAVAWTISILFVWPYFTYVSGLVYLFYTVVALLFAGVVNRYLLLLILIIFCINKTLVVWFQNFMLILSGFLAAIIYWLFAHFSFWEFLVHFLIITFSIFVYYTLVIKVARINGDD